MDGIIGLKANQERDRYWLTPAWHPPGTPFVTTHARLAGVEDIGGEPTWFEALLALLFGERVGGRGYVLRLLGITFAFTDDKKTLKTVW